MRVHLKGVGLPHADEALPDSNVTSDLSPLLLALSTGDFVKAPYVTTGYDHYEVWCVGAAGGYGSNGYRGVAWPAEDVGGVQHIHDPYLDFAIGWGGAGGGGGMHHVVGVLADLPDSVPVVVGQAGADADPYAGLLSIYTPEVMMPWFMGGTDVYDLPHPTFYPPMPGEDGEASSFNGATCRASGGKGGLGATPDEIRAPGMWEHDVYVGNGSDGGHGGDGGVGGSAVAGGGAAGSSVDGANGADGTWDGSIGQGGGGAKGGYVNAFEENAGIDISVGLQSAASGGQGSFSFGDTSVYGVRGTPAYFPGIQIRPDSTNRQVVPGAGGGARPSALSKYGARVSTYSPNGIVLLRLFKTG